MAHELDFINGEASIAYVGETPWHKLGTQVTPEISIAEWLAAAKLDWTVEKKRLFWDDGKAYVEAANKNALVRSVDNKVLTYCSDKWEPVQNAEVLEFFREYMEAGGVTLETAGALRGGKNIWGLAKINREFKLKSNNRDVVKGYLLMSTSHEVGMATSVRATSTRVVCANTLQMAERDAVQYRQNHLTTFNAQAAKESVGLAIDWLYKMENEANILASQKVSDLDAARFISHLLQPANTMTGDWANENAYVSDLMNNEDIQNVEFKGVLNSYFNAPGAEPGTLWGVANAFTHWADHTAGRGAEQRLFRGTLGDRSRLKSAAWSGLLELAA